MTDRAMDITPLTPVETLYVAGHLSRRASQCCAMLHLFTVRDVASFHYSDPRYTTMAGCGKRTARELNAAIKAAYGRFPTMRQINGEPMTAASASSEDGTSWQARWEMQTSAPVSSGRGSARSPVRAEEYEVPADSIAAEWEASGTLTAGERRFARECAAYARFVRERRGVPASTADIDRHRWYLRHRSALERLNEHCRLLFEELMGKVDGAGGL